MIDYICQMCLRRFAFRNLDTYYCDHCNTPLKALRKQKEEDEYEQLKLKKDIQDTIITE